MSIDERDPRIPENEREPLPPVTPEQGARNLADLMAEIAEWEHEQKRGRRGRGMRNGE